MDLREMFHELAGDGEPPTTLCPDSLYAAGRRRTRTRWLVGATATASSIVAIVVALASMLGTTGGSRGTPAGGSSRTATAAPTTPAAATASPGAPVAQQPGAGWGGGITWADAVDARHLYAILAGCDPKNDMVPCTNGLYGSDNSGATWTLRSTAVSAVSHLTAGALISWPAADSGGAAAGRPTVSTDGGRHWSPLAVATTPVASVPSGGFAFCPNADVATWSCTIYAVDVGRHRAAPLASQPAFTGDARRSHVTQPSGAGSNLWMPGGTSQGLTVAVSRDAGRTWTMSPAVPGCGSLENFWHSSGATAKLLCRSADTTGTWRLFRTDDYGATWRQETVPQPVPFIHPGDEMDTIFMNDGTLVGEDLHTDRSPMSMYALPDGATAWRQIATSGWAGGQNATYHTVDGRFLSWEYPGSLALYLSTDMAAWNRVNIKIH